MGSKLLQAASKVDVPETPRSGQATKTVKDIFDAEKVASAIERQFPNAVLNEAQIKGQGRTATGEQVVVLAVKQTDPNGTAALYHNGTLSLSGAMCELRL